METGKCCDCGAETSLFVNGIAICVVCDARRDATATFPVPLHPRGKKPDDENLLKARFAAA